MADLLTPATLATWTQNDPAEVAADPFALDLIAKVSSLICMVGGHPEWTLEAGADQAPIDVQMVALQVIKRSYENPGRVIQEGGVGPIGGDRVADAQALFADFTDSERATVAKYNPDGDPTPQDGAGFIFTLPTTRGDETTLPTGPRLYVPDDQQINMTEDQSVYPSWDIPLFNPGDPGGQDSTV